MGRFYTLQVNANFTLANDIFQLEAATDKPIYIHSVEFGQTSDLGDINAEGLKVLFKNRITAAVTDASGEFAVDKNDTAFSGNANVNQTAVTTGEAVIYAVPWNTAIPYLKVWTPEFRPFIIPGDAFTVNLNEAPGDSIRILGTLEFEEMG